MAARRPSSRRQRSERPRSFDEFLFTLDLRLSHKRKQTFVVKPCFLPGGGSNDFVLDFLPNDLEQVRTHNHDAQAHDAHHTTHKHTHITFNIHTKHKTQLRHISVNLKYVSASLFISSPKDGITKNIFSENRWMNSWKEKGVVGGFEILEIEHKLYNWEPFGKISDHGEGDYQALPEFVVKVRSESQIRERGHGLRERRSAFREVLVSPQTSPEGETEPMSKRQMFHLFDVFTLPR